MSYSLQVVSDDPGNFRWLIFAPTEDALTFAQHSVAECNFSSFEDALNAGTVALARLEGQPYENEAVDPVGGTDCA